MSDGGAQRVVSILANYLDEKDYQIRIITFRDGDHYKVNEGIERIRLHKKPLINSVVFSGFFSLLSFYWKKSNRPDVLNSHIDLLGYLSIPIAKIFGLKIIVSEHNNYLSSYTYAERFLWTFFYPLVNAVTILTSFDLEYFSRKNKNVHIMPNPCSFELATNTDHNKPEIKEVLAIGQLNRYHHKGFDNLLDIAKEVLNIHPDWTFKVVGAGDKGAEFLKAKAKGMRIENSVIFTGYQSNIKELLSQTDIFILPSRFEGLPMTLLEAMSQGTPCIAYNCVSGPSDIISNGENGLLIENQNKEAMVNGLLTLIEDAGLRRKFRKNAPPSLEKFSIDKVGQKWEKLLNAVASKNK